MNAKSRLLLLIAAAIPAACSGQVAVTDAGASAHRFVAPSSLGDWANQWTNLTVAAACPPWGCSYSGTIYVGTDRWPPKPRAEREAMQQLAKRLRELKKEEELQNLLQAPALSQAYCVSFSRGTNSVGQKP